MLKEHCTCHHHITTDRTLYKISQEISKFCDELISNQTFKSVSTSASINRIILLLHTL